VGGNHSKTNGNTTSNTRPRGCQSRWACPGQSGKKRKCGLKVRCCEMNHYYPREKINGELQKPRLEKKVGGEKRPKAKPIRKHRRGQTKEGRKRGPGERGGECCKLLDESVGPSFFQLSRVECVDKKTESQWVLEKLTKKQQTCLYELCKSETAEKTKPRHNRDVPTR